MGLPVFIEIIMKLVPCLFFLFFGLRSYTQSWDLRISDSAASLLLIPAIEDSNANFLLGGMFKSNNDTITDGWLLNINAAGDTLLSKRFPPPAGSNGLVFSKIFEQIDGYLIFGSCNANYTDEKDLVVLKTDFNLNELWTKRYGTTNYRGEHFNNVILNSNGNFVGIGAGAIDSMPNDFDFFLYEFNPQGDSLNSKYYPYIGWQWEWDILEVPNNAGYKLFTRDTPDGSGLTGCEVVNIDSNLDVTSVIPIDTFPPNLTIWNNVFLNNVSASWLNDSIYMAYARVINYEYNGQNSDNANSTALLFLTSYDSVLSAYIFGKPDTSDAEAIRGLDNIYGDAIYTGCTANYWDAGDKSSTSYNLNKIDSAGNILWQKYYGGNDYYKLFSIKATQDGGCLMVGTIYDTTSNSTDIYIIKVGPDGVFVPGVSSVELPKETYSIYPNPTNGHFTIRSNFNLPAFIELYDLTGRLTNKQTITSNRQQVNVNQLAKGLYVYQLISEGKVARGKVVVE